MPIFAIYVNVRRGTKIVRDYIAKCEDTRNLSRMRKSVADFVRNDGTYAPRKYVHFSRDKAAQAAIYELSLQKVIVDENGNCQIAI